MKKPRKMNALKKMKPVSPFAGEVRYCYGPMKCMAVVDGYVMARRPYMMPVVMSAREWLKLSEKEGE